MICGNSHAELNNDTQTSQQERDAYVEMERDYEQTLLRLLVGETIERDGNRYSLADRLVDEHERFAEMVDADYDFMTAFVAGELNEETDKLIEREARILASIVVG